MAYAEVSIPGDGVTTLVTVDFALGIITPEHVTLQVGGEVDGAGDPVYRPFEYVSETMVQVSGLAAPIGQNYVFRRRVPKDELVVDWENGDAITGENLNKAQLHSLQMAQEALDLGERSVKVPEGMVGPSITIGAEDTVLIIDADGNIVPGPTAGDIENAEGYALAAAASAVAADNSADAALAAQLAAEAAALGFNVPTRAILKALDPTVVKTVFLSLLGCEGIINWRVGDYSARIASDPSEAIYFKADSVPATSGAWVRNNCGVIRPSWFGTSAITDGYYDGVSQGFAGYDWVPAFTAALAFCNIYKLPLYVPAGNYRFARQAYRYLPTIDCPSWVNIIGEDRESTIFMIDQIPGETFPDNGHKGSCLFGAGSILEAITAAPTRDLFSVKGCQFYGVWDNVKSTTARFMGGVQMYGVSRVRVEECAFVSLTGSPAVATNCGEFVARGNRVSKATSDGIRAVGTPLVTITDNTCRWVADDAIAVHSMAAGTFARPVREAVVISNNIVMDAKGISCLGANRFTVTGNHVIRGHGNGLGIGGRTAAEGAGSMVNCVVSGNHVDNTMSWIDGGVVPAWPVLAAYVGSLTVGEGVIYSPNTNGILGYTNDALTSVNDIKDGDQPWGGSYSRDGINDGYGPTPERTVGTRNIVVSGNVVTRTLKSGSVHSAWGFGQYYTWSGWIDPVVTEAAFFPAGIAVCGDVYDAAITGNTVAGFRNGAGVYLRAIASTVADLKFTQIVISGNVITDVLQGIGHNLGDGQHIDVAIRGNTFDCDPFVKQALRRAAFDGSWTAPTVSGVDWSAVCLGIDTSRAYGWTLSDNIFRNCYAPIAPTALGLMYDASNARDNTMECQPAFEGYNVSNLGIGYYIVWPEAFNYRSVGSNPKDSFFRKMLFTPLTTGVAKPSTGWYPRGWFVRSIANDIGVPGYGWQKYESGSDNTKWTTLNP